MDIAVKQRILGGVVLVAAAILFLPVVLEGAGVKALQPPAPPTPPTTPTTQDLAPALQQQAQGLAKDISASHGEPTFYPVEPVAGEETAPTPATAEQFRLVDPSKAKPTAVAPAVAAPSTSADDKLAEQQLVANQAAAKATQLKMQAAADAAAQAKRDNAAADKPKLAADKIAAAKLATEKLITEKLATQKLAAEKKAAADKLAAEKAQAAKTISEKAAEKPSAEKAPAISADPDPALPQAWVVQVARLNAQDKANALADKLRARGYRATASGSGESWRVVIGPELERAAAESVKRRLAEDPQLKLSGWIQAYRP